MTIRNHYDILGLSGNASVADIKAAFRRLALKHHPDQGGSDAAFRELKEAFEYALKYALDENPFPWSEQITNRANYDPFLDPDYGYYEFFEPENDKLAQFERMILAQGCRQCLGRGVKAKIMDPGGGFMSLEERFCICQRVK